MLLQKQFIKLPLGPISDIQQNRRIPYHLHFPRTPDIHRTARQMIGISSPTRQSIHLRRPIPRINNNRLLFPRSCRSPQLCRSPRVWRQSTVACDFTLGPDPSIHPSIDFTLAPDPSTQCHMTILIPHSTFHLPHIQPIIPRPQLLQPPAKSLRAKG